MNWAIMNNHCIIKLILKVNLHAARVRPECFNQDQSPMRHSENTKYHIPHRLPSLLVL